MEKELKEKCDNLFDFFAYMNQESPYGEESPLSNFIDYYPDLDAIGLDEIIKEKVSEVLFKVRSISFGIGYVMGQCFDITYPDAQEDIEAIKRVIKEKQLLPYLPRERRMP